MRPFRPTETKPHLLRLLPLDRVLIYINYRSYNKSQVIFELFTHKESHLHAQGLRMKEQ